MPKAAETNTTGRRGLLLAAAALPITGAPASALPHPDAALFDLCADHLRNLAAVNADTSGMDMETCPTSQRYLATLDAVLEARPRTLAGVVALARVAQAEALLPDGSVMFSGSCAETIAENVIGDLIRLAPEARA
jgi:hypothetical protein